MRDPEHPSLRVKGDIAALKERREAIETVLEEPVYVHHPAARTKRARVARGYLNDSPKRRGRGWTEERS